MLFGFLSVEAVDKAKSGHPELPLGAAGQAYALWTRHLRVNPQDPHWFNRDRFVLSASHGSALPTVAVVAGRWLLLPGAPMKSGRPSSRHDR
jgi:transketolase